MKLFSQGMIFSMIILIISLILFRDHAVGIFIGWLLPILAGTVTMSFIASARKKGSITLTKTIAKGFVLKMIYYGISILFLFKYSSFQPIPFVCSFSGFFIGLHVLEAVIIKRISESYSAIQNKEIAQ